MTRVGSIRALAALVGVSHTTTHKWTRRPDWPFGRPPWPASIVGRVERWREASLFGEDGNARDAGRVASAAKLRLLVARTSKIELQRAILAGDYIPRRDVEIGETERRRAAAAAFAAIPALAPRLAGMTADQMRDALDDAIRTALDTLAGVDAIDAARVRG
ncbi:MAG: hypothetical protein AB7Q17_14220 [Phycisphaerae bacterium]